MRASWVLLPLTVALAAPARAADDSVPGAVTAPFPTIENASIEWALAGDDDGDATVSVRYREAGGAYRDGLPLRRIFAGTSQGFSWENRFAGSLFGLTPGTTYEVELTLTDPDGGDATQTVTLATRPRPAIPSDARQVPVDPDTIDAALDAAEPGDVLVLADGTYGEITVPNDGEDGRPIALRPENAGGAVVEGDVRMDGRSFVTVEGLTVHGKFKFNDARSIVVLACTIQTPDDGIVSFGNGVENATIVQNTITGPTIWMESALGVDGDNLGEGIQLTGPGNVVAYNSVRGFRDCLSLLEDDEAVNQISVDFYGNDLSDCADDAVEADFSMGNVRVYGNRVVRSFMGLSSQPSLGGPTYFFRNALYGVLYQAFKLQRGSSGDVGFHNTIVKSGDAFSVYTDDAISFAYFRNNLFIGAPGGTYLGYDSGPGDVIALRSADTTCDFDYDGYGSIGTGAFDGRIGDTAFSSLVELQSMTTEVHAVEVDLSVFAANVTIPSDPFAPPPPPSLLLADGGAAVDQGVVLPNINDDFAGSAPDLGAFELGEDEPTYGPPGGMSPPGGAGGSGGMSAGGEGGEPATGGTANGGSSTGGTSTGGSATGGTSTGGSGNGGAANGGTNPSGGTISTGGSTGGSAAGTTGSAGVAASNDDGGCSCRLAARHENRSLAWLTALGALVVLGLRRRASRVHARCP